MFYDHPTSTASAAEQRRSGTPAEILYGDETASDGVDENDDDSELAGEDEDDAEPDAADGDEADD
jgi:hypothetical protein